MNDAVLHNRGRVTVQIEGREDRHYDSIDQFRLIGFCKDGDISVDGKLPLKVINKPFRSWVRGWAASQDLSDIEAIFKEQVPNFTPQLALTALNEAKKHCGEELFPWKLRKRDKQIAFHIICEILRAIFMRLKQEKKRPVTTWEFPQSHLENPGNILDWLFRKG